MTIDKNDLLNNMDFIKERDIKIGDMVQLMKAGDVIPAVVSVDVSAREKEKKDKTIKK